MSKKDQNERFDIRVENPVQAELRGFPEPNDTQIAKGKFVVILKGRTGTKVSMARGDHFCIDALSADRLIAAGYARPENEWELAAAKSRGMARAPYTKKKGAGKPKEE